MTSAFILPILACSWPATSEFVVTPQVSDYTPDNWDAVIEGACRSSLYHFVLQFWPVIESAPYIDNWHIEAVCDHLAAVTRGDIKRIIFNVPPGTSKSLLVSVFWPCWAWINNPKLRFFYASYDQRLSSRDSVKCRNLMRSAAYRRFWGDRFHIVRDQNQKTIFENDQGGWRMASSVCGHSTGTHPDVLVCLPWESAIITDAGVLPIGRVVEERLPVKVLSFDHMSGQTQWASIEEYETNEPCPLCRVHLSSGRRLELTGDHPVFVSGVGYVRTDELRSGDEVLYVDPNMPVLQWSGEEQAEACALLQSGMFQQAQERHQHESVSNVRQIGLQDAGTCEAGVQVVLFTEMSRGIHQGEEPSFVPWARSEDVFVLQEAVQGGEEAGTEVEDVQRSMPASLVSCTSSASAGETPEGLRLLWCGSVGSFEGVRTESCVLLSQLCQQVTLGIDAGAEESQLGRRELFGEVLGEVYTAPQTDTTQGILLLFLVQHVGEGQRAGAGRTPYRLRQDERHQGESRVVVQGVSLVTQREAGSKDQVSREVVSFVEQAVRIPDAVYNIRVAKNHNYFAEGVLVHNCDDPHSALQAASELERQRVIDWWDQAMSTRGISRSVAHVIVMQRLHHEDLSGHLLKRKNYVHFVLPMRYEKDRMEPTPLGWVDPRRVDGQLLTPKQFPEESVKGMEIALGVYGAAGQLQQRPAPKQGGLFKEHYFNQRRRSAPYNVRRIRYWDRASSLAETACYTAGVLLAQDTEGNYYVEDVVHGRWEPTERNAVMRATAMRDRSRYGPSHEPRIYVEAEGGSSGVDAWKSVARALDGFPVFQDRVTGKKDVRAEPWASQLASNNVYLIDNGETENASSRAGWDIVGYITEHVLFKPDVGRSMLGRNKDRVDASTGAYNLFVNELRVQAPRIYSFKKDDPTKKLRLLVCTADELESFVEDRLRCLLVSVRDPLDGQLDPIHGVRRMVGVYTITFADLEPKDHQATWDQPVPPYDLPISKLTLSPESARDMWKFLLKRDRPYEAIIFQGNHDRRAHSLACGVADALGNSRKSCIEVLSAVDISIDRIAVNQHIVDQVKTARSRLLI